MKRTISICLLAAGAALVAIGCSKGQPASVLAKAVTVCLECMGIG